ncbi:MAG: M3 family metallopeptidase [Caldilineaceae bacterium]
MGKQGGAASIYLTPPFNYMSYDESLTGASILAHELGHSMHSYLSKDQHPEVYIDFDLQSMAVAETASTFHQAMLRNYLQRSKQDDRQFTLAVIDEAMFNFHSNIFRLLTLARFEFTVFSRAESGQSLTVNDLNGIMGELFAEGYGETMTDGPTRTAIAWAQFGHTYRPFYSFQYAVGQSAAEALATRVLSGVEGAATDYLAFLRAGSTRYPLDLFKLAGVDMTSPEPVEQAFAALAGFGDRLEELTG